MIKKSASDATTNRRIGGSAPSAYLQAIENKGMSSSDLDAILQSHGIDPSTLRADDFEAFLRARAEHLLAQIERAMGKTVNRSDADAAEAAGRPHDRY